MGNEEIKTTSELLDKKIRRCIGPLGLSTRTSGSENGGRLNVEIAIKIELQINHGPPYHCSVISAIRVHMA